MRTVHLVYYLEKGDEKKRISSEVSVDSFYLQENMTRLRNSVTQMEAADSAVYEVKLDD